MMTRARAQRLLRGLARCRVAVIGDLILDRYIMGSAERISPEAPVPVVRVRREDARLGGAANVMRNVTALGAAAFGFGVIGADEAGDETCRLLAAAGINAGGVLRQPGRCTTVKTRIIAAKQQIVRIDDECTDKLPDRVSGQLLQRLRTAVTRNRIRAVIIEDYHKGAVTQHLASGVQALAAERSLITTLDPHPASNWTVRGLTLMKPNRAESFAMTGIYPRPTVLPLAKDRPLHEVAARLRAIWAPETLLISLGAEGMALFGNDGSLHHIPTMAREVYDLTGAGDTVIAVATVALLAGATPLEAAELANHAAGIVVGRLGTACVTVPELLASFAGRERA
jgi:D-glycero-beta-D-manno-heptose-7-phosphate kinase